MPPPRRRAALHPLRRVRRRLVGRTRCVEQCTRLATGPAVIVVCADSCV